MHTPMKVTQRLADFALATTFESLPTNVVEAAKLLLLDTIGCALGAVHTAPGIAVRNIVSDLGLSGPATVIGTGQKTSVGTAAWANARLGNILDMDECYKVQGHHAQASLGAALALSEQLGKSGADLLVAFVMGFEVGVRLGNFLSPRVTVDENGRAKGWTGLVGPGQGVHAACTASAVLMQVSAQVLADGFGNCAQYMVGRDWSRQWGRDPELGLLKYADTGWNAQGGLMAALHAREGIRGIRNIFDSDSYTQVFQGALQSPEAMLDNLGVSWHLPETSIKFWPCCRWIHYALTAFDLLKTRHKFNAQDIESIELCSFPMIPYPRFAMNDDPLNLVSATFSFAHAAAMIALDVPAGPAWFSPENMHGTAANAMRSKIKLSDDPRGFNPETWGLQDKVLKVPSSCRVVAAGQTFEASSDFAMGDAWEGAPAFSAADIRRKYRRLALSAYPNSHPWEETVERLESQILQLETIENVRDLSASLSLII